MHRWIRPFLWPLLFIAVGVVAYTEKVEREMVDFNVYRTAAARAADAQPLYDTADGHYQFKYLPAFALAMIPFALIDREGAKVIWFALSAGLLTAFVRWSVRSLPERRRSERALLWLAVLFMAKFYAHELTLGQTNILLGVLLVGALLASQVDLPILAGVLLGVTAFVKPYALLLLPWLGVTYGMTPVFAGLGAVAIGLVAPAVVYGWSGNLHLLTAWLDTVTSTTNSTLLGADNVSFAAMWAKWIGPGTAATWLAIATSSTAVGLVALAWSKRRNVSSPEYLEVAMLMLLIPLLSPQGWDYVLLLGTPAVIVLVDRWSEMDRRWRVVAGLSIVLMGLTIFDLMGRALYAQFMSMSIVSVAAIGVAAALTNLRWRALG